MELKKQIKGFYFPGRLSQENYHISRIFTPNSKLKEYLIKWNNKERFDLPYSHSLYQIILSLKEVILSNRLFDENNPSIILCDSELEEALDCKALHVYEIGFFCCKQLQIIEQKNKEPTSSLVFNDLLNFREKQGK